MKAPGGVKNAWQHQYCSFFPFFPPMHLVIFFSSISFPLIPPIPLPGVIALPFGGTPRYLGADNLFTCSILNFSSCFLSTIFQFCA